jgi:putative transposase
MCKMLEVSSSAFYDWRKRPISNRERENKKLAVLVKTIFEEQRDGCGTRTIKQALSRLEVPLNVSRRRIGRIMDEETLECITVKKFKITTDSKHNKPIACNVLNR